MTSITLPPAELDRVDLLVTDVAMPGGDGPSLAEGLVHERPRLRVLYVSGYAGDTIAERGVLGRGVTEEASAS